MFQGQVSQCATQIWGQNCPRDMWHYFQLQEVKKHVEETKCSKGPIHLQYVFSPLCNVSLQWNLNSWANQRQRPEFFVIMHWEGRQAKSFPATCSYLWDIVTLALACYIVCYTSLLHASSVYCTWLCAYCICLLDIPVCTADFILVARCCSNSLQPVSSGLPTFDPKFTPKL